MTVPNVRFGSTDQLPNWRDGSAKEQDDEDLEDTPVDVVEILGFDPSKEYKSEEMSEVAGNRALEEVAVQ